MKRAIMVICVDDLQQVWLQSTVLLPMYSCVEDKGDSRVTDRRQRTPQRHRHAKKADRQTAAGCQQLPAGSVDDAGDCQAGCSGTAGEQSETAEGDSRRSARLSHSEIEKRRRNKLNSFIYELAALLPKRDGLHQSKKLDKLSILRLSVHHLRNSVPKSTLPTPDMLLHEYMGQFVQILMDADEFLTFIIDGQTETFMYVSESSAKALEITQAETQNLPISYIVHPDDLPIIRQQFHPTDTLSTPSIFPCRMKTRTLLDHGIAKFDPKTQKSFVALTCYALLKKHSDMPPFFSTPAQPGRNVLLVLAVMNDKHHPTSQCRLSPDGKFIAGDERFAQWLGCAGKICSGTSLYQYCHPADVGKLVTGHRWVLEHSEVVAVGVRFVGCSGPVRVVGTWRAVRRPFDNAVEGIDVVWTLQY